MISSNVAPASFLLAWYAVDLSELLARPWDWFRLPAAVIAVVCFLWLDQLRRWRIEAGPEADKRYPLDRHPGLTIYYLQRLQQVLVTITAVIGLWYFGQWVHHHGSVPEWFQGVMVSIYGAG